MIPIFICLYVLILIFVLILLCIVFNYIDYGDTVKVKILHKK